MTEHKSKRTDTKPTFFELLKQSLQDVEGGYDLLAPKFDHSRYVTPDDLLYAFFEVLKKEIEPPKFGIDICCGTGAATKYLADFCTEEIVAFDLSQNMLDQCRRKLTGLNPNVRMKFIKGNALNLPFENRFDLAISFGAFGHIRQQEEHRFIEQVYQSLRPGGYFCFITTGKYPLWSMRLWYQRIFNTIIHIRNLMLSPPFIMYYLTFRLPKVRKQLEHCGFSVQVIDSFTIGIDGVADLVEYRHFKMIIARK